MYSRALITAAVLFFTSSALGAGATCEPDRLVQLLLNFMAQKTTPLKAGASVISSEGKAKAGTYETDLGVVSVMTDRGPITEKTPSNQDGFLITVTPEGNVIYLVADGISTGGGGAIASSAITQHARTALQQGTPLRKVFDGFIPALQRASAQRGGPAKMGSTVLALEIEPSGACNLIHAGDVRLVKIHGNKFTETKDHNLGQERVDAGRMTQEERLHNSASRQLTKDYSIGDGYETIGVKPQVDALDLEKGDLVIVASDGLWGVITTQEVVEIVNQMSPPDRPATTAAINARLREEVRKRVGDGLTADNVTILVHRHTAEGF